uniref:Calcium voltage-gated channel auxiliary subunit gamma 5 n=1 Tax=Oncorhynchus kisutch TaxID=8019 RepID=A0A8C7KP47_ONCKI
YSLSSSSPPILSPLLPYFSSFSAVSASATECDGVYLALTQSLSVFSVCLFLSLTDVQALKVCLISCLSLPLLFPLFVISPASSLSLLSPPSLPVISPTSSLSSCYLPILFPLFLLSPHSLPSLPVISPASSLSFCYLPLLFLLSPPYLPLLFPLCLLSPPYLPLLYPLCLLSPPYLPLLFPLFLLSPPPLPSLSVISPSSSLSFCYLPLLFPLFLSGLALVVGLVLYISSINDEMLNRTKSSESYFSYRYGWSFAFAAISFLLTESAGVMSVYLFMKRYTAEEMYQRHHPGFYRPRLSNCSDHSGQFLHPETWARGRSPSDISSETSLQMSTSYPALLKCPDYDQISSSPC